MSRHAGTDLDRDLSSRSCLLTKDFAVEEWHSVVHIVDVLHMVTVFVAISHLTTPKAESAM